MPSNVEIKARLRDREAVEALVRARADHGPELIVQEDVFFACETGRLKLRRFSDDRGELIFYRRLDTEGPDAVGVLQGADHRSGGHGHRIEGRPG